METIYLEGSSPIARCGVGAPSAGHHSDPGDCGGSQGCKIRAWANIMSHGQNASTFCFLPISENTSTFHVYSSSYGEMDLGFCGYWGAPLGHHIYATTGS